MEEEGYVRPEQFLFGVVTSVVLGTILNVATQPRQTEGRQTMVHPHGEHDCYCPVCGYQETVDEGVMCSGRKCPVCGQWMRAVDIGERRLITTESPDIPIAPMEIVGRTQDELASGLEMMESSINYGDKARVTLCTEVLPDETQLAEMYLGMLSTGHHVSYPTCAVVDGVPTTEFVIKKGSPFWPLIIPLIVPVLTLGLVTFGIFKIDTIVKALVPIILISVGGLIVLAAVLSKPATKYIERGGKIPYLPATGESKKALAVK